MCGLVGYIEYKNTIEHSSNIIETMANSISHRGPDLGESYINRSHSLFMGFRRLSILDLSSYANQPIISENKKFVMMFNGEIYNFKSLNKKYLNNIYKNTSDTKILIELFSKIGIENTLDQIEGMFAISLYSFEDRTLYLVRDKFGKKPMYYYDDKDIFIWGSELKAFHQHPNFKKEINFNQLYPYVKMGYFVGDNSIYKKTFKLKPGHLLIRKNNTNSIVKYSKIKPTFDNKEKFDDNFISNYFDELLTNAVNKRLVSDVPIGCFLSGGIDSTLVTAIMSKLKNNIDTFTIGFEQQDYNEAIKAKKVSNFLGTNHTEIIITKNDYLNIVPNLSKIYDEPFADSSQIPTLLVSELARSKVTVALSGDGGDELFCGYNRYILYQKYFKYFFKIPNKLRKNFISGINKIFGLTNFNLSEDQISKINTLGDIINLEDFYNHMLSAPTFEDTIIKGDNSFKKINLLKGKKDLSFLQINDFNIYLPDDILVKVDRASMYNSLEVRCPYLDDKIVSNIDKINVNQKIKNNQSKWVLRSILKKYIDPKIIEDKKRGFGIPLNQLIKKELKPWVIDTITSKSNNFENLDYSKINMILNEHFNEKRNHHFLIWNLAMLHAWKERWN